MGENSVSKKVNKSVDFLRSVRNNDKNFIQKQNLDEEFPVPTFNNPNAIFMNQKNIEIDGDSEIKLSEKKLRSINTKIYKAGAKENMKENKFSKLELLRAKMLKVRKANEESVIDEQREKAKLLSKSYLKRKYKEDYEHNKSLKINKLSYVGVDSTTEDPERLLRTSAEAQQRKRKKIVTQKNQLNSLNRGGMFNTDAAYHAYNRRVKNIEKMGGGEEDKKERIEKMSKELEETELRREIQREKNKHKQDNAVSGGISLKNDRYNERLGRAFDEYTTETRNNLERGTAL